MFAYVLIRLEFRGTFETFDEAIDEFQKAESEYIQNFEIDIKYSFGRVFSFEFPKEIQTILEHLHVQFLSLQR